MLLAIRNLITNTFKKAKDNKALILCTVGALAGLIGFANNASGVFTFASHFIGNKVENLSIIQARLKPFRSRPDVIQGRDEVFLHMKVRNYGATPLIITSADAAITHSATAHRGLAGSMSRCTLSKDPNENTPINIAPGETAWITIANGISLPGLSDWLTEEELSEINVLVPDDPFTISQNYYVQVVNDKFSELFGPEATIRATLYTGAKGDKHVFNFSLANGKDIFAKDGSLQHDWFIANWKHPSSRATKIETTCIVSPQKKTSFFISTRLSNDT